tara:strand:+ start:2840 stop:4054 length:1215 start_codon:yes stop_codon:yes gene_type:complete
MKKYSFLITFFTTLISFGQYHVGNLNPVLKEGIHAVTLSPEIRAAALDDLNLLRIKDANNNEIPYVSIYNSDKRFSVFSPISIISKEQIKDSITSIVIKNKADKTQETIVLVIANTNVSKKYTVYGSNNAMDWFGLVANEPLTGINSQENTTIEKAIDIPLNSYQFLKLNFKDKNSLPINILNIGVYDRKFFTQEQQELSSYQQEVIFVKEKKRTRLKFTAANAQKINSISFKIATQFYLRNVKVIVKRTRIIKKRTEGYEKVLANFQLNSENENNFTLNNLNEKEFILEIDNQDNPPLEIRAIKLFQKPIHLVADLKKEENYTLIVDETLKKPLYDLGNFISNETTVIATLSITNFSKVEKNAPKKPSFWQNSIFMWACIILGGAMIVFFSTGLVKSLNNENQ